MPPVPVPEDDCEEDYPVGTPVPAGSEEDCEEDYPLGPADDEDCEEDYPLGPADDEDCEEDASPTMMPSRDVDLNLDEDAVDKDDDYNIVDTSAASALSLKLSVVTGLILLFC
jgi:hypothetical protein